MSWVYTGSHELHIHYYTSTEHKSKTKNWEDLLSGFYNVTVTRVLYKRKSFSCLGKFFVFMCTDSMSTKSWRVGAMAVIPALESRSNLTKHRKRINVTFNYIMKNLRYIVKSYNNMPHDSMNLVTDACPKPPCTSNRGALNFFKSQKTI